MSSVKKYFSLKLLKTRQQMNDSGSRKLKKNHNQTNKHQQSMSVSDEDLFEGNFELMFCICSFFSLVCVCILKVNSN